MHVYPKVSPFAWACQTQTSYSMEDSTRLVKLMEKGRSCVLGERESQLRHPHRSKRTKVLRQGAWESSASWTRHCPLVLFWQHSIYFPIVQYILLHPVFAVHLWSVNHWSHPHSSCHPRTNPFLGLLHFSLSTTEAVEQLPLWAISSPGSVALLPARLQPSGMLWGTLYLFETSIPLCV